MLGPPPPILNQLLGNQTYVCKCENKVFFPKINIKGFYDKMESEFRKSSK